MTPQTSHSPPLVGQMPPVTSEVFTSIISIVMKGKSPLSESGSGVRSPPPLPPPRRPGRGSLLRAGQARPLRAARHVPRTEAGARSAALGTAFPGALGKALARPNEAQAPPAWGPLHSWQDCRIPNSSTDFPSVGPGSPTETQRRHSGAQTCACAEKGRVCSRLRCWAVGMAHASLLKLWGPQLGT